MKSHINVNVNGVKLPFEVDTGSPVVLLGESVYQQHFRRNALRVTHRLYGAGGESLDVAGEFTATLRYGQREGVINVVVQRQPRECGLLGVPALNVLFPNWKQTFLVNNTNNNDKNNFKFDPSYVNDFSEYVRKFFSEACRR